MTDARDIVERYFGAFHRGESQTARRYLADSLLFSAPAATITGADAYLSACEHAIRVIRGVESRKVFVDGPDVCIFYDVLVDHPVGVIPTASWFHLDGDKISAIRTILDTAPFARGVGERPRETSFDLVCGMPVPQGSAAPTRTHRGTPYYFCSSACAEAFEADPEKYLASAR
jgi:YHS domain-containing protein